MRENIRSFSKKKIGVIGDFMVDHWVYGSINRISPEAPVPILDVENEEYVLGGAGNTARNLVALGATVYAVGVTGTDFHRETLLYLLQQAHIHSEGIFPDASRRTTSKERLVAQQQLLRADREHKNPLNTHLERQLMGYVLQQADELDAIIVSDYDKGVFTSYIAHALRTTQKILVADIKPSHKDYVRGYTVIKPNRKEGEAMTSLKNPEDIVRELGNSLESNIVLSLDKDGMLTYDKKTQHITPIPAQAHEVCNVTGAGDLTTAVLALALTTGLSLSQAAELANIAAGIGVQKKGTIVVSQQELLDYFS